MTAKPTKKNDDANAQKVAELTADLQRIRADFENFRKRVESEKTVATANGEIRTVMKLLPVVDTIHRAIGNIPNELANNTWVQGVVGMNKQLDKMLKDMNITRINANNGTAFDPEQHQAVQFDEDAKGDAEVVAEELQSGYLLNGSVIRAALVKVTKK